MSTFVQTILALWLLHLPLRGSTFRPALCHCKFLLAAALYAGPDGMFTANY